MIRIPLSTACALALFTAPLFAQTTIRATAGLGGAEPDGDSESPYISGDGRFVAFLSHANNLVAVDTQLHDVFLFDASTGTTELISVRLPGPGSLALMQPPSVSDDGNFVVWAGGAENLAPGYTGWTDVLLRDRSAGTTTRITAGWTSDSQFPVITPDGRYIAFQSTDETTVPSGPGSDVFLHDRQTGLTTLVSRSTAGVLGNALSVRPAISADGLTVAFQSAATNLVPGDTNGVSDVFVHDILTGTTRRASVGWSGGQLGILSRLGNVSGDGRRTVFTYQGDDATTGETGLTDDVYYFERSASYSVCASAPPSQRGSNGNSDYGRISRNGRYIAFWSTSTDLVSPDPTTGADVYLKDTETNAVEIVSLTSTGIPVSPASAISWPNQPSLSADARFVAFSSGGSLVPGDAVGFREIYIRDRGPILYTTPCAGDGSSTPCPCGNPGSHGNGCENYALQGGARLSATGSASITNDTLRLSGSGFLYQPTPLGFVQGDALLNGAQGAPFGDGVLCVGGHTVRFGRRNAIGGSVAFGAGVVGDAPVSIVGHVDTPGVTRYYQVVYFNFGSFCGQLRRNWSNSIAIVWGA